MLCAGLEPTSSDYKTNILPGKLTEHIFFVDLRGLEPPSSTCKADILPIETTDPQSLPRDLNPDLKNKDWILSPTRLPIPPERDALGGTRTHNLLINSQLLYQLSYKGISLYNYIVHSGTRTHRRPSPRFSKPLQYQFCHVHYTF